MNEKDNIDKKVAGGNSRPAICSTRRGYQRALCSQCGEPLGFTEGDPCDNCFLIADTDNQEYEPTSSI